MNLGALGIKCGSAAQALGQESCAGANQLHHWHLAQHNLHHLDSEETAAVEAMQDPNITIFWASFQKDTHEKSME